VALFFLAYFASAGVYSTYLTVWLAHKGLTATQIGLVMAAVNATRLFGPNLWGEVARRQGHQARVVAIGVTTAASASVVLIVAGDALSLELTLLAIGVMTAGAISLTKAILMQLLAGDTLVAPVARAAPPGVQPGARAGASRCLWGPWARP
jgi:hypothetical protein